VAINRINCRIDKELEAALRHFQRHARLPDGRAFTRSQAVREVLRQALTSADPPTRGWHEGYAAGFGQAQKAVQTALAGPAPAARRSPPGTSKRPRS
jgi:hypothetical protein